MSSLDTQELEYSIDLSDDSLYSEQSDHSSSDITTDSDTDDEKIFTNLKPYDFEPTCEPRQEEVSDDDKKEGSRIGNTGWCLCENCKEMTTEEESYCCLDTNEVPEDYFEGQKCITLSEGFRMVCLAKPVLHTALSALNNLRGDPMELNNRAFRFAGYKQYTWWVHNYLGKGVRKVIPSCAVWRIRNEYPSEDGEYVPFMERKEDEEKLTN